MRTILTIESYAFKTKFLAFAVCYPRIPIPEPYQFGEGQGSHTPGPCCVGSTCGFLYAFTTRRGSHS